MTKLVYYPAPETPLTREEIAQEFARLGRKDPLARALRQILAERLAAATIDAAGRDLNAPGRLEEIMALQAELAQLLDDGAKLRQAGLADKPRRAAAKV